MSKGNIEGQKKSVIATDGTYYLQIQAEDEYGNKSRSPLIPIVIDTITPQFDVTLTDPIFSPNEDQNKETLSFEVIPSPAAKDVDIVSYTILNDKQKAVLVHHMTIADLRQKSNVFLWDGTDQKAEKVPEGRYALHVTTKDLAANTASQTFRNLILVRTYETATLVTSSSVFSPDKNGIKDTMTFTPSFSRHDPSKRMENHSNRSRGECDTNLRSLQKQPQRNHLRQHRKSKNNTRRWSL